MEIRGKTLGGSNTPAYLLLLGYPCKKLVGYSMMGATHEVGKYRLKSQARVAPK
jgi:hypothetical protein